MQSYITLENVCKKFKSEEVLKNVSVGFQKGNIYGIVGKNGSGKTLLLKPLLVLSVRHQVMFVWIRKRLE